MDRSITDPNASNGIAREGVGEYGARSNAHWGPLGDGSSKPRGYETLPVSIGTFRTLLPGSRWFYWGLARIWRSLKDLRAGIISVSRSLLRKLVASVVVHPTEKPGFLDVQIMGRLSTLLRDASLLPRPVCAGMNGADGGTHSLTKRCFRCVSRAIHRISRFRVAA